jgi:hypothetical protein
MGQWHITKNTSEHLTTMMFVAARRLAGSANAVSRSANAARNVSCRFMSVVNLSDDEAVKKFRAINTKSVLYFTASCKYSTSVNNLVLCGVTLSPSCNTEFPEQKADTYLCFFKVLCGVTLSPFFHLSHHRFSSVRVRTLQTNQTHLRGTFGQIL